MDWSKTLSKQVMDMPRSGIREFFDLATGSKDIISLGVGEPDFVTPWNIREAAIRSLERGHTTYTSNYGLESLRRAISTYVADFFHVEYDPLCEILPTVGVSEAIDLALRCLLNPGDEVLYHEPCYVSYAPTVMMAYGTHCTPQGRALSARSGAEKQPHHKGASARPLPSARRAA